MKKYSGRNILACFVIAAIFWGSILYGCASVQKGIKTGSETLAILGTFYDKTVDSKAIPEMLKASTIILQQADVLASMGKVKDTPEMVAQARVLKAQAESLGVK